LCRKDTDSSEKAFPQNLYAGLSEASFLESSCEGKAINYGDVVFRLEAGS